MHALPRLPFALTLMLCAALLRAWSPLGGVERDCTNGPPIPERWAGAAAKWTYVYTTYNGQEWLAPGIPVTCTDAGGHTPGLSTLIATAEAFSNAAMPGGGPRVSSFQLDFDPTARVETSRPFTNRNWQTLSRNDGRNLVSFFEPPGTFGDDPTAFAATAVRLNAAGAIVDADIAFQTLSERRVWFGMYNGQTAMRSTYSFVDESPQGVLYNTDVMPFYGAFGGAPAEAYIDLAGTFMHELGHLAGIEHSLLDSSSGASFSRFPTMFFQSQSEPFIGGQLNTFWPNSTPPCTPSQSAVSYQGTRTSGIFSRSARTLELDDLHALAEAYPRPVGDAFFQQTGTITGSIAPLPGPGVASVVAFRADSPDVLRVTTMTDDLGSFTLRALPPGPYYVFVEPIDRVYFGAGAVTSPLPTFIDFLGCNRGNLAVMPEFYDANESANELSHMVASTVDVQANATTSVTIVPNVATLDRVLWVGRVAVGPTTYFGYSMRGLRMPTPYTPGVEPGTFVLEVRGLPSNTQVTFVIDLARIAFPLGGQLVQVLPLVLGSAYEGAPTGYGPTPAGTARIVTGLLGQMRSNVFIQACYPEGSELILTNTVNLWYGLQ